VHPSAEHDFLYFFQSTFLGVCSSPSVDASRLLFETFVFFAAFADDLLFALPAELTRVEVVARRLVEVARADEFLFFFLTSFTALAAATAAAASAFLSWLSL
jgi:hypothetical protein